MNRRGKQFQRVSASVKLGVEAMQKLSLHVDKSTVVDCTLKVQCHNCHTENDRKRCFCRKCKTRMIHSYG